MVFSSHVFVFYFLPLALLVYGVAPRRGKHLVLTAFSYLFYGWSNPWFVFLMAGSTAIDYCCGRVLAAELERGFSKSQSRCRAALLVSIVSNLSLLGFFKYFNFGLDSYNALVGSLGLDAMQWDLFLRITLPLGISFYTFQSMSYTIDVYRGEAKPIRNFLDFACYVSMFPQLVAGPIIRFHEVAEQLQHRTHTLEKFARGTAFFCLGMAKKVLLANPCGKIADTVFDAHGAGVVDSWVGLLGYSFQIYFDFSGYSDMAIGLGLMFGFVFPKNFDRPYLSQSITELWQRWHLSLSFWLRDYLYIPLGGNRKGSRRTYANLAMVMLLGGLWHGASWNFVIWGAIHGGMLALERLLGKDSVYRRLPAPAKIAVTFLITMIAWVFFRASDLSSAFRYLGCLVGVTSVPAGSGLIAGILHQPYYLISLAIAGWVVWACRDTWDYTRRITSPKVAYVLLLFAVSLVVLTTQSYNPFIYFIF